MFQGNEFDEAQNAPCCFIANDEHDEDEHAASKQFLLVRIFGTIKAMIQPSDEISDQDDRMEARARIAKNAVDEERENSCQHPFRSPMISSSFSMSRCSRTIAARRS